MAPAISSLPVPVSPRMSTVELLLATLRTTREHLVEGRTAADDALEVVGLLLLVAEVVELVAEPLELERLFDLDLHLLDFERLLHVVEGAVLHRLDRGADRAERRHQDDRGRRMQRLGGAQHVEAIEPPIFKSLTTTSK